MQTTAKDLVPASNGLLPWHPDIQLQSTGMQNGAKENTNFLTHTPTPLPNFLSLTTWD